MLYVATKTFSRFLWKNGIIRVSQKEVSRCSSTPQHFYYKFHNHRHAHSSRTSYEDAAETAEHKKKVAAVIDTGVPPDLLLEIWSPTDRTDLRFKRKARKEDFDFRKKDHQFNYDRQRNFGPELAAAHFIVARGGRIKFKGFDEWQAKTEDGSYTLPNGFVPDLYVEAIDASGMKIDYIALDNIDELSAIRFLSLSGCPNIDDFCLDRLYVFSDSLEILDLSSCYSITKLGLACLHKLRNLRKLVLKNIPSLRPSPATDQFIMELEDCLPEGCFVEYDSDYSTSLAENE